MTTLLIVDDEPAQLRGLHRAISLRKPSYTILTAASGAEAISVLQTHEVGLVLTDLRMADMDGFELLAWLLSERAQVLTFAMTAHADDDVRRRLNTLGDIECLTKPLDLDALLARFAESFAQTIEGHVQNIGLASFLQLIEIERKTCSLRVQSPEGIGQLYFRGGELLDACTDELRGEAAALAIVGWPEVTIDIGPGPRSGERRIDKPVHFIIMEALRLRDEASNPQGLSGARQRDLRDSLLPCAAERHSERVPPACLPKLDAVRLPAGALAVVVVDLGTGALLGSAARVDGCVLELAQGSLAIMRQEQHLSLFANQECVEELALMTPSWCELIRPLASGESFVAMMFDAAETNLVMARFELDMLVGELASAPTQP